MWQHGCTPLVFLDFRGWVRTSTQRIEEGVGKLSGRVFSNFGFQAGPKQNSTPKTLSPKFQNPKPNQRPVKGAKPKVLNTEPKGPF